MWFKNETVRHHLIYGTVDFLLTVAILFVSFLCAYGFTEFLDRIIPVVIYSCSIALAIVVTFSIARVYRIITIQTGLFEVLRMVVIIFAINLVGTFFVVFVRKFGLGWRYSWMSALATATLCFLLPSVRVLVRVLNVYMNLTKKVNRVRTLVIGAGSMGKIVIDETRRNKDNQNKIVVVVDDDKNKFGSSLGNIPVTGPISNTQSIIEKYKAKEVIIAISNLDKKKVHEITSLLSKSNVRIKRMPLLSEMEGPNDRRIIDVDLEELLNRDSVVLDNSEMNTMLRDKTVLVTGAGGSIGSELVRQIFNTHPKTLILFDIYENSTYEIQMELVRKIREGNIKDIELVTLIGSTYNEIRVEQIMKKYRPDYVYHAAAYKHVPLMEDSPAEAIRTNVLGTYNVAKMADKYGVKKMVLVSTDKAVRPTNVMGATKRFAETIIQYFSEKSQTKYAAVRFGNVLGSNGSVVPLFKKQIEAGGPITITDKRIIRYFMTIPEAVSLILQCGLFANGGEIFILDMGKPVKIINLAEKLIKQAGLVPYVDIDIIETGLRPGEKLFEELLLDKQNQIKTKNKKVYIEPSSSINRFLEDDIKKVSKAFGIEKETEDVKTLLHHLINSYVESKNRKE